MERKIRKAAVDKSLCVGSSMCIGQVPEAFQMDDDGHAEATGWLEDPTALEEAAEMCPVSAIILTYEE